MPTHGVKTTIECLCCETILDYENNRLEQKYPDFRLALQQRRDDLLLAAITRRESRQVSLSDSVALKAFFKEHRTDYNWDSARYRGPYCMEPIKRL